MLENWDEAWLFCENVGWNKGDAFEAARKAKLIDAECFELLFPGALATLPAQAFGGARNYTTRHPLWWMED